MASLFAVTKTSFSRFTGSSRIPGSPSRRRTASAIFTLVSVMILIGTLYPAQVQAGIFNEFRSLLQSRADAASLHSSESVQSMPLPKPAMNLDPNPAKGGGDITIIDGEALVPEEGPAGTMADLEKSKNSSISIYVVREGDTLSGIASMFGVTPNTIKWANDLPAKGTIRVGQTLTILPVTGVKYTTKKGDTLASIAKKFGADSEEIANFNAIDGSLLAGSEIIIPDGEIAAPAVTRPATKTSAGASSYAGYFMRPIAGGVRTQGVHGYNAVDLAAAVGTPIVASASGEVIVAKEGGWNGGYGSYVVVKHANGTQTLYSHASSVTAYVGQSVIQGQVVAYVGSTGKATGPHVHFEIRGGPRNPF